MNATQTPAIVRPCCPLCGHRMTSDEDIVRILDVAYHQDCADEHQAEIIEREREAGVFEGMDVRSDDFACDFDF